MPKVRKIAVIGSGITGLTVARNLKGEGEIQLYDKSTGVGGRMATRSKEGHYFDHGAQFFTVRTKQFKEFLKPFISSDKVARWEPKVLGFSEYGTSHKRYWFEEHYVGFPKMTSLCKQLAKDLNVNLSMTVEEVEPVGDKNYLHFANKKKPLAFDWVVAAMPAAQILALYPDSFGSTLNLKKVKMFPCYTLMLQTARRVQPLIQAASVQENIIRWISENSSKPGRHPSPTYVVHSSYDWAKDNALSDKRHVQNLLEKNFCELTGLDHEYIEQSDLHFWRHAVTETPANSASYIDRKLRLAACGDWCSGQNIEDGFLSGMHMAENLKEALI